MEGWEGVVRGSGGGGSGREEGVRREGVVVVVMRWGEGGTSDLNSIDVVVVESSLLFLISGTRLVLSSCKENEEGEGEEEEEEEEEFGEE